MSKTYNGFFQAKIVSYNKKSRTARVTIPTVTDGIDEGITATFAYPVGHDDRDTEIDILPNADCYIFFRQGEPSSPVIWAYSSHGVGAITDYRRIRQENIELLARANVNINAKTIHLKANTIILEAENVLVKANLTTKMKNNFENETIIQGKPFMDHGHKNVQNGGGNSGGVA